MECLLEKTKTINALNLTTKLLLDVFFDSNGESWHVMSKRGKTRTGKSRLVLVLLLIG